MDLSKYENCRALKQWIFVSNAQAYYRPCCWFRTNIDAKDVTEYREKLSKLDIEKNCSYCIKMESSGGTWSPRTEFERYNDEDFLVITASFDNLCNLKCVTCHPESSSQLATELKALNPGLYTEFKLDSRRFKSQAVEKVDFMKSVISTTTFKKLRFELLGGEPLINPQVFEFLDWLTQQPIAANTQLTVTTNGTTYTPKLLEYAKIFSMVNVQLSIDGINETLEYLRFNSKHEILEDNAKKYHQHSVDIRNFTFAINFTLSWMNSLNFVHFFNWAQNNFSNLNSLLVTKLEGPPQYSVDVLSTVIRNKIAEYSNSHVNSFVNQHFERGYTLFQQHLSNTQTSELNLNGLLYGKKSLIYTDAVRKANHNIICSDIYKLISENITPEELIKLQQLQ